MTLLRRQPASASRCRWIAAGLIVAVSLLVPGPPARADLQDLGKGHRILLERGLQVQGMVIRDDLFHLETFRAANYTTINWIWAADPAQQGPAPGFPWARWVHDETQMPPTPAEQPYLESLVCLQLGDEWDLNDPAVRDRTVEWLDQVRDDWPETILAVNNFGGQVNDAALGDFVARGRPDLICFDTYPFRSDYQTRQPIEGSPTGWYGDLRRYRVHALLNDIPLGVYRQTFHAVQDYDQTVYRHPSPSELRLNTFGALAFGATMLIDFTYNTGASSLFTPPGGDSNPTPLYSEMVQVNRQVRHLGPALTRLVALNDQPDGGQPTTDILFIRGQHLQNDAAVFNAVPVGFAPDPHDPGYTDWEAGRNDPYMRGWSVTNPGTKNDGLPGDVILSWFTPLDESFDGPEHTGEVYLMVVNGLAGHDGTAADYRQQITLNFAMPAGMEGVQRLDPETGRVEDLTLPVAPGSTTRRQWNLELDGGSASLFKLNTGAPFVGAPERPVYEAKVEIVMRKLEVLTARPTTQEIIDQVLEAMEQQQRRNAEANSATRPTTRRTPRPTTRSQGKER